MAQDLIDKIREQAQARGLDPEIAVRIAQVESSMDPSAKAKTSSAQGLFQVVDSTWKQFGGKPGKKADVDENIRVGLNILESNTKSLKNALGREPSATELYAAHFLGAQGAKTLLTASPDTPVSQLLSQRAIKANPSMLKDKNVEQLMGILNTKMGMPAAAVVAAPSTPAAPMPAAAAGAPRRAGAPAAPVISKGMDLGTGYQAALALAFLGDEDEQGPLTSEQWRERQDETSAAKMMAAYKPKNALQDINWDESSLLAPQKMAEGGEVSEPNLIAVPGYSEMVARDMYPAQQGQFDQQDAARHMLASGTLARKYGPGTAEFLGHAHEVVTSPMRFIGSKLGLTQMPVDYEQDLHNNRLGIELARRSKSQKDLEDLVQTEAERAAKERTAGKAWVGRPQAPVKRADGSPQTGESVPPPTQEEIDAAMRPMDIRFAQKSGIGRKISTKPGEIDSAIVQGISETPYNVVGAFADLPALIMRPFGYTNPTPIMGSEWLKQQATRLGVRQAPPEQPTARAFYEAAQLGSSLVNPVAPVRAAATAAERVAPAIERAVAAAAPVARSTAAQMLEKVKDVPVGMSIKPVTPIFQHVPTDEAPFVGRLDEFVAGLQSPVRKDQFLGQLKNKFRDYEIARAEDALQGLPANAKLTPSDLLNRLKERNDPSTYRTTIQYPGTGHYHQDVDNVYFSESSYLVDRPLGVIHLSLGKPNPIQEATIKEAENLVLRIGALRHSTDADWVNSAKQAVGNLQRLPAPLRQKAADSVQEFEKAAILDRDWQAAHNSLLGPTTRPEFAPLREKYLREFEAQGMPAQQASVESMRLAVRDVANKGNEWLVANGRSPVALTNNLLLDLRESPELLNSIYGAFRSSKDEVVTPVLEKARNKITEVEKDIKSQVPLYQQYRGQHPELKGEPQPIAFSRFSEHTAQIPGLGKTKGIYVNELQSDRLEDIRRSGSTKGSPEKDREALKAVNDQLDTVYSQKLQLEIQGKKGGKEWTDLQSKETALYTKETQLYNRIKYGNYKLEEPFPGMEHSPQVIQQLMVKNAVAGAIQMDKRFVAFPGAESKQPQLYENLPNNLKQVVKDLGPGFELRDVTLKGPEGQYFTHPAIVWGSEAAAKTKFYGVPFKDGGMVERRIDDSRKYL